MKEGTTIMKPKGRLLKGATWPADGNGCPIDHQSRKARPIISSLTSAWLALPVAKRARLNVLNVGREPINLSLNFTDSAGRLIKQSFETVEGGHAIFLDLTPGPLTMSLAVFRYTRRLKHPVAEATGAGKASPP